jgi:hypothetical protein
MTTTILSPSVFESFNARNLDPHQVARRFIPPRHFDELILRQHSLVIGPRGSGKTTLLKMLQLPALAAWTHTEADRYRAALDFTGVFVAADVSWGAQLSNLGDAKLDAGDRDALGYSAFTTHMLIALVRTMTQVNDDALLAVDSLRRFHVEVARDTQSAIVNDIAKNWELSLDLPTFNAALAALRGRLAGIAKLANQLHGRTKSERDALLARHSYVYIDAFESVSFGVEQFNAHVNQPYRKWALLFDELEIAPPRVRQALFAALRSTNQNILFKLSISPYHQDAEILNQPTGAMPAQDFHTIELWYARKEHGYEFSRQLLRSMAAELDCAEATPEEVFGRAIVDWSESEGPAQGAGYGPGSPVAKRYKLLAEHDASFKLYLENNGVDLDQMHTMTETRRAGLVRKITSIVAVRETYRSQPHLIGKGERIARSRKNPILYSGSDALFAIVEGNPRWLIGLMGPLLRQYSESKKQVDRGLQTRAVATAANRFRALLRTIPFLPGSEFGSAGKKMASRGLLSLLDAVGEQFHRHVVVDAFKAEPVLSFVVDSNTSDNLLEALGRALNAGAIILVPDNSAEPITSAIKGKRFRLSYMLAAHYRLPLILGKEQSLAKVLRSPVGEGTPLFEGLEMGT